MTVTLLWNTIAAGAVRHQAAIACAILAGLLVGAPSILAPLSLGPAYQGMPFLYQDNEYLYVSRIRDVLDGHPSLGSPYLFENKEMPTALPPNGEYLYAVLSYLPFVSLIQVIVLTKFLFPALIFVLMYALAYMLARDLEVEWGRLVALAVAALTIFGNDFLHPSFIWNVIEPNSQFLYLSSWSRVVNPTTGALFLFAFLIGMWGIIRQNTFAIYGAGVAFGVMSGYVFSFGIAAVFFVVFTAVFFILKRLDVVKGVVVSGLVAFVINIPQLFNFYKVITLPGAESFSLKNGLLLTHTPLINKFMVLATVLGLTTIYVARVHRSAIFKKNSVIFLGCVALSFFIVTNQQIVTGKTIWPQHFTQYGVPLAYLIVLLAGSIVVSLWRSVQFLEYAWKTGLCLLLVVCFSFGARTAFSYSTVLEDYRDQQRYQTLFSWVNENAEHDCTIFAVEKQERLTAMIPALTACNTYDIGAVFVGFTEERIKHNFFSWIRFMGVTDETVERYLSENSDEFRVVLFSDWKELFSHNGNPWLESISDRDAIKEKYEALAPRLASEYREFYAQDFKEELLTYRLDYMVWDRGRYPEWSPTNFDFLKEVYADQDVHLYEIQ